MNLPAHDFDPDSTSEAPRTPKRRSWMSHERQVSESTRPPISSPLRTFVTSPKTLTPSPERKNSVKQLVALFESKSNTKHHAAATTIQGCALAQSSQRSCPVSPTPRSRNASGTDNEDLPYDASIETTLRFATARLASPRVSIRDLSSLADVASASSSRSSSPGRAVRGRESSGTSVLSNSAIEVVGESEAQVDAMKSIGESPPQQCGPVAATLSPRKQRQAQIYAELENGRQERMRAARRFL